MLRPNTPNGQEMLHEDTLRDEARPDENEETPGVATKGLPISDIKKLLEYCLQIHHILEQDTLTSNEGKIAAIPQALFPHEEMYRTHVNNLQQRKLSDYLQRKQPPQPAANPQPSSASGLSEEDSDEEFHGFMDGLTHRRGGGRQYPPPMSRNTLPPHHTPINQHTTVNVLFCFVLLSVFMHFVYVST